MFHLIILPFSVEVEANVLLWLGEVGFAAKRSLMCSLLEEHQIFQSQICNPFVVKRESFLNHLSDCDFCKENSLSCFNISYFFHVTFYGFPFCSKMSRQRSRRRQRKEEKRIQTQILFSIYILFCHLEE